MDINEKEYKEFCKKHAKSSPLLKDVCMAFLIGGIICTIAEGLFELYLYLGIEKETVKTLVPITLIFLSALTTGIGIYDDLAKIAGAGTLVPITGFANAVVSPAIDDKSEGMIMGVGAKMFTIAGPVIVYGVLSSVIYGVIYWLAGVI